MYTRRKVFSIANDYDYNDYYERLYSDAFDDGIDYAIEKYFADNKAIGEGTRYLPAIPADENAIRKNNKKQICKTPKIPKNGYRNPTKFENPIFEINILRILTIIKFLSYFFLVFVVFFKKPYIAEILEVNIDIIITKL